MKHFFLTLVFLASPGSVVFSQSIDKPIQQLLSKFCLDCHDSETQKGDLDLERFGTVADIAADSKVWEHVLHQIHDGEMPPKKKPQFSNAERELFTGWVQRTLDEIALANAGDPGPVVLRRLSNREYTYTIRDLTGVESLDPAREFPVDGAAGEGFTNVGSALVMSPALLTKYLDAAKDVANHAMLLPDGIEFSPSTSPADWTQAKLNAIRNLYAKHTTTVEKGETVKGGIRVETGVGSGHLPVGHYLDALQERGNAEGLNSKYLGILRTALEGKEPSLLLDPLRQKFRTKQLTADDIEPWQRVLWRFVSVEQVGKKDSSKTWLEPIAPFAAEREMRIKLGGNENEVTLFLTTTPAGDGSDGDDVIWENARLISPGLPEFPIDVLPDLTKHLEAEKARIIEGTEDCLNAIAGGHTSTNTDLFAIWEEYLGHGDLTLEPLLTEKVTNGNYNFISGWRAKEDLSVVANSSPDAVRVPGLMKGNSIATHPSPSRALVIAWRSPVSGKIQVRGDVADAHTDCGNGILWSLEVRRGRTTEVLASGESKTLDPHKIGPFENVPVEKGEVVAFVISPGEGNHVCDLTALNLTVTDGKTTWDLAKDVSPKILESNPIGPWHFLSQPAVGAVEPADPAAIAAWRREPSPDLAKKVREHLESDFPLNSPLLARAIRSFQTKRETSSIRAKAPSVTEVKIPAAFAKNSEFVVRGKLASVETGSVQMQVLLKKPSVLDEKLLIGGSESILKKGQWTDNNLDTRFDIPVLVNDGSDAKMKFEKAFGEFRDLFPVALCYPKIVPVDGVVTLKLYFREDHHLKRLMLDEAESARLDRLWDDLFFVSDAPLKQVDAFDQIWQYATQDADPSALEPFRETIRRAAEDFRARQKTAETRQRDAAIEFAAEAWRRPLSGAESTELVALYQKLRDQELPHEASVRQLIARVLVAPKFLYRGESAAPGPDAAPVSDWELATRLSYFLWSSSPDAELKAAVAAGDFRNSDGLAKQTHRMISHPNIRRLATEFGTQWLHVRSLETLDEKSERHFPEFTEIRADMQEEAVRFFIDLFGNDQSLLSLLDADHSFVSPALAKFYGIESASGGDWQRVEGLRKKGRGGILGFSATLAKHSGASRTSPILRGNWVSEVLLGEKLPRPPKDVPVLPEEAPEGLTERQLIERHSTDASCVRCHAKIDPLGFALEGFDAIGRSRGGADVKAKLNDGTEFEGIDGLRGYLIGARRDDFVRQFCRKFLGYALGRSVQLSDQPLLDDIQTALEKNDFRVGVVIEKIVQSPQFQNVRGRDFQH